MNGFTPGVLYDRDRITLSCRGLEIKLCHIGPWLHVVLGVALKLFQTAFMEKALISCVREYDQEIPRSHSAD